MSEGESVSSCESKEMCEKPCVSECGRWSGSFGGQACLNEMWDREAVAPVSVSSALWAAGSGSGSPCGYADLTCAPAQPREECGREERGREECGSEKRGRQVQQQLEESLGGLGRHCLWGATCLGGQ